MKQIQLLLILIFGNTMILNADNLLKGEKKIYQNEKVLLRVDKLNGNNGDWIGIYPKGSSNAWKNVKSWIYTNGTKSMNTKGIVKGTLTLPPVPLGEYEARLFFNNSYKVKDRINFSVIEQRDTDYVSGTFIQLNPTLAQQNQAQWSTMLEQMYDIGIDTIIIQYSAYNQKSFFKNHNQDPIEHILKKADELGMDVFLGLGFEESFDVTYNQQSNQFEFNYNLQDFIFRSKQLLLQLYAKYGFSAQVGTVHPSLVGWYFPIEFSDANVIRSGHKQFRDDVVKYYSVLSKFAHEQSGLETMISPYFSDNNSFYGQEHRDINKYAQWWNDVLDENNSNPNDKFIDIDILAHQDSIGVGHISLQQENLFFKQLEPVLTDNGVQLWSNNEAFTVSSNGYKPTSFQEFQKQLHNTSKYVQKSIFFEFPTYMKGPNNALYDKYKEYYEAW